MHGLVSLLDTEHYQQVESIWQMLENECGLSGIKVTPFPHFSWLVGSDFDWPNLESALRTIVTESSPFTVRTTGLGLFSGAAPVIFIPVIRNAELSQFHSRVWENILPIAKNMSSLYSPVNWVPHISLAYADVSSENISCAMKKLAFQAFNWEFSVNNLALIYEPDGQTGQIRYQFNFEGSIP